MICVVCCLFVGVCCLLYVVRWLAFVVVLFNTCCVMAAVCRGRGLLLVVWCVLFDVC